MMSTFDANLTALRTVLPALAQSVARIEPPADFAIEHSRSGLPTARRGTHYLHSRHSPRREATRIAASLTQQAGDCYVIYGIGLAYLVEALLETTTDEAIVVVEADLRMLAAALSTRLMDKLLMHPRLRLMIAPSPAEFTQFLSGLRTRRATALGLPGTTGPDHEYYHGIEHARRRYIERQEVNSNTLRRFGRRWVRNLAANAGRLATARRVAEWENVFRGTPATVCAGGPSLDEALPAIPDLAARTVVIAVDTAVPPLLRVGVEPDFIVVVDPQYWNTRHVDNLDLSHSLVIGESATHPRSFRVLERPVFLCSSLFPLGRFLEAARTPFGSLGTGGSVTTTAWDFARHVGADPIYLAGLDLGYPGFQTHVTGSLFEERSHTIADRIQPAEGLQVSYIEGGRPYFTRANDGSQVLSDQRMAVYKDWFALQQELPLRGHTPLSYNLSRRGVLIDGLTPAPISHALRHTPRRNRINATLRRVEATPHDDPQKSSSAVAELVARLSEDLDRAGELAREATEAASRQPSPNTQEPGATAGFSRDLAVIEEEIRRLESKDIIGFLLESVADEVSSEAPRNYQEALDNSRRLYGAIAESAQFHRDMLQAALSVIVKE